MQNWFKFGACAYFRADRETKVTALGRSENLTRILIHVARVKIYLFSPLLSVICVTDRASRLLPTEFKRHKQSEILKHCRTKCDNSACLSTPLDRMYPSHTAHVVRPIFNMK